MSKPWKQIRSTDLAADGAIDPKKPGDYFITKATAIALTIAAPTAADTGNEFTVTSTTAAAHVITFTGGTLWDGTAGVNSTATYAALQGASITFIARGTLWFTKAIVQVTPAP